MEWGRLGGQEGRTDVRLQKLGDLSIYWFGTMFCVRSNVLLIWSVAALLLKYFPLIGIEHSMGSCQPLETTSRL
ncbi:hypothetical protein VNO78_15765 [Psophocarpus tetragonolobus]|uniref:Uncharacterized protein n=1 Tax=Psophocarpus tetragonolobus TaxID=3891 RepID=A0AAN9XJG2_PSOTE